MESNLSNWFDLAEIWGAVMLIDEADIYLETRTTSDLQRNSLVSGEFAIHHLGPYVDCFHSVSASHGVLQRYPIPHNKPSWSHRRRNHESCALGRQVRDAGSWGTDQNLEAICPKIGERSHGFYG